MSYKFGVWKAVVKSYLRILFLLLLRAEDMVKLGHCGRVANLHV